MMKNTKNVVRLVTAVILVVICIMVFTACDYEVQANDTINQQAAERVLKNNQQTPTDIDFSLERYNLIRRAYWVNGQREKAAAVPCTVQKPLGYIVLFTESGAIVNSFIVDGKVSSLNSYLSPDSEYFEILYGGTMTYHNEWLADVDGSYGQNDDGIFFFTPDGKYIEWTGTYLYSDIPFIIDNQIVQIGGGNE